jgi:hypothetical protein
MHGDEPQGQGARIDSNSGSFPLGKPVAPADVGSRQSVWPAKAISLSFFRKSVATEPLKVPVTNDKP